MRKLALFSLAVAALVVAPALLIAFERSFYRTRFPEQFKAWERNGSFSMVDSFTLSEDNYEYAARVKHAGTHALPGDPYIRENRSARLTATDFVTFLSFGLVHRLTGDIKTTWVLAQFLFTLAWVPLLFALLRGLGAGRAQAVCVAAGVTLFADLARVLMLGRNVLSSLAAAVQYAFWFLGSYHYFFGPSRITGPLFTYACLFLAGLAFVRAAGRRTWGAAAAAGLAGGALAYVHSDVWLAFLGAAFFYCAHRAWVARRPDARLWAALGLAVALSLPLVWLQRGAHDPELLGVFWRRYFDWRSLPLLAGAWLALRLGREGMALWCASTLFALFLASNAQLVTGWSLHQGHWLYIGNIFLALVIGRWVGGRYPKDGPQWLWLAVMLCLLAVPRVVGYAAQHYKVYGLRAAEEEAFDWIEKNAAPDAVVAALSPQTNLKLPVHTKARTVVSFLLPVISDISREENADRLAWALRLYGVTREDYVKEASDRSGDFARKLWGGELDHASVERSDQFAIHFAHIGRDQAVILLQSADGDPYPVDYLWVGAFERALMRKPAPPGKLEKVFENAEVAIYKAAP